MVTQIKCGTDERRQAVRNSSLNGIDYLEVFTNKSSENIYRALLLVHCFQTIRPSSLFTTNVLIAGGTRITGIMPEWAQDAFTIGQNIQNASSDPTVKDLTEDEQKIITGLGSDAEYIFVIRPNSTGDFSTYTLQLVSDLATPEIPPDNFDIVLSSIDFSFKVDCPSEFDCAQETVQCIPQMTFPEPIIDYMAKDYESFRKLMLDRLSMIMPNWQERNPSDQGIALVELLAYVGDQLSYHQDAVATEAYLGTARSRVSLRRHVRLLDYQIKDGCNARAWISLHTYSDNITIPQGTQLLTGNDRNSSFIQKDNFADAISNGAECFQTMYDITLYLANNEISFYTWGEPNCCLPRGATSVTLLNDKLGTPLFSWNDIPPSSTDPPDELNALKEFLKENFSQVSSWIYLTQVGKSNNDSTITISTPDSKHSLSIQLDNVVQANAKIATLTVDGENLYDFLVSIDANDGKLKAYRPTLNVGDVLIFEEVRSPTTGRKADKDISHRQAVRLTTLLQKFDELYQKPVMEISWGIEDALSFPLCINQVLDPDEQKQMPVSVARGNIVLADHGYTYTEDLGNTPKSGKFTPQLSQKPLTFTAPFDQSQSAFLALNYDSREALPCITKLIDGDGNSWTLSPNTDLLESNEFDQQFVVEMEDNGTAFLRFGDGVYGMMPRNSNDIPNDFTVTYRVGNGAKGNVGFETITSMVVPVTLTNISNPSTVTQVDVTGVQVRNPMPAQGGTEPETMEEIRNYAPWASRTQERAVTEADYEQVLLRRNDIFRAAAQIRWTGSWYTVFIAIDRVGGQPVDSNFKTEIYNYLNSYRLTGYDIEITEPAYVPLDIEMTVCISSGYSRSDVERALIDAFSNRDLGNGNRGFFYPDNFTFGQSVFLSQVYATAMKIPGVGSVNVTTFQRWAKSPNGELEAGAIKMAPSEIARLDNNPNFPENGKIVFTLKGEL